MKRIRVESGNGNNEYHTLDLEASFGRNSQPIYPNCRLLEINTTSVPKEIKFEFWNTENMLFHLNIVEKNMALTRRRQKSFAYKGPFIGRDNFSQLKTFGLSLKQSHYSDQDAKINCINYPTKNFDSFQDCDENFTFEEMKKIGVMPFWAAKDNIIVTSSK